MSTIDDYRSLLGVVSSIHVRSDSSLFKERNSKSDEIYKDVEKSLKEKFDKKEFPLESIESFVKTYISELWIAEQENGPHNGGFNYAPSNYLDFKDKSPMDEDWHRFETRLTDSRKIANGKNKNNPSKSDEGKYNEFFIVPKNMDEDHKEYLRTWYDIMLLFGIRREQLFNKDMSERIYNIGLPIAKIVQISDESVPIESIFLLCPIITFHKKPNKIQFRRTVSVSLILIPVTGKKTDRKISVQETFEALWDVGDPVKFKIANNSPLLQFLENNDVHKDGNTEFTREQLIKKIVYKILSLITEDYLKDEENNILTTQIRISLQKIVTYFKECDEKEISDVFDDEKLDSLTEANLRMMVYPYHYFADRRGGVEAFPANFKLKDLIVNDKFLFDSSYLLFYNPRESYLAGVHYKKYEEFPKLSMKWYFFLDLYLMMEISLFKVILSSIYRESDEREDLQSVINVEKELVTDLDEFYDLDLSFNSYKDSYEKIKVIAGINESYKAVKDKLNDVKNYFSLVQQRRINLAIIILTAFTVASSLILFPYGTADILHVGAFWVIISVMALTVPLVWFKYGKSKN